MGYVPLREVNACAEGVPIHKHFGHLYCDARSLYIMPTLGLKVFKQFLRLVSLGERTTETSVCYAGCGS